MHNKPHTAESKEKMRQAKLLNPTNYWLGKEMPKSFRDAQLLAVKGKLSKLKGRKFPHLKKTEKWYQAIREAMIGSKNPLWKGGITPVNRAIRMSFEMKQWRVAVFKRDDYRCLDCGIKGGDIHADHIYPFAYFPRLRFDLNNGRTLCVECHRRTPTYGNRKVQYAE
jgi:hypothetical protein